MSTLLDDGKADTLYAELRRWPFIRSRMEGLTVHNAMREMINEALRVRAPERFRILHKQAAAYYRTRMAKVTGEERERYARECLYHCIWADEVNGVRLFQEAAEEYARYHMANRLRALLNDANNYQLEQENSRLWREYYNACLTQIDGQLNSAEGAYQAIGGNENAEAKLRAYALCDWGSCLRSIDQSKQANVEKAAQVIEQGLSLFPLDAKLVLALPHLSEAYWRLGRWAEAFNSLERARKFCIEHNDHYGVVYIGVRQKYLHLDHGEWKQGLLAEIQSQKALAQISEASYLKAELLGGLGIAWTWMGRYAEGERNLREALRIAQQIDEKVPSIAFFQDLGLILAMQDNGDQVDSSFSESLELFHKLSEYSAVSGVTWTLWGAALLRRGELDRAEEYLERGRDILEDAEPQNKWDSFHTLIPIGVLHELRADWIKAESHYRKWLDLRSLERRYFDCANLIGLIRVKFAQSDSAAIPPLWTEAVQLAQQYEYNDHFAALYLTRGHITWDGLIPEWESGFDSALHSYQLALIHALRYNRFLLDEVLGGRRLGTPLRPVIQQCLGRGKEGQQMLVALRDWWQSSRNEIGTPRPDSISPLPEGIPLLEAERMARSREPGNESLQTKVTEQIGSALKR